jgi:hypothetical protein
MSAPHLVPGPWPGPPLVVGPQIGADDGPGGAP